MHKLHIIKKIIQAKYVERNTWFTLLERFSSQTFCIFCLIALMAQLHTYVFASHSGPKEYLEQPSCYLVLVNSCFQFISPNIVKLLEFSIITIKSLELFLRFSKMCVIEGEEQDSRTQKILPHQQTYPSRFIPRRNRSNLVLNYLVRA